MQNKATNSREKKKTIKDSGFSKFYEKLKSKDEMEVRSRIRALAGFALIAISAYLVGGAELPFSTFPLCLALLCSSRKHLPPISLAILALALTGRIPPIYIFACLSVPLIRLLVIFVPRALSEMSNTPNKNKNNLSLIPYAPNLPEKANVNDKSARSALTFSQIREESFNEHLPKKLLSAFLSALLCGVLLMITADFSIFSLWGLLVLIVSCPIAVALFDGVFGNKTAKKPEKLLSVESMAAICVYAAKSMSIIGMPMSPFLALLLTLSLTSSEGLLVGIITSVLLGLALDILYLPLLLISVFLFFFISALKKNAGLAAVCAAVVVWCYYVGGSKGLVGVLPPMLLAIPVFMVHDKYREIMYAPYDKNAAMAGGVFFAQAVTEKNKNAALQQRLGALSEAFSALSETFYKLSDKRRRPDALGIKRICESCFDKTCMECKRRELCHGECYLTVLDAIKDSIKALHEKGSVEREDLSPDFITSCNRTDEIIESINRSLSAETERMIGSDRLGLFAASYGDVNEILKDAIECDKDEYKTDHEASKKIFDILYERGYRAKGVVVYGKRRKQIVISGMSGADKISAKAAEELRELISDAVGSHLSSPSFELGSSPTVKLSSRPQYKVRCSHGRIAAPNEGDDVLDLNSLPFDVFDNADGMICGDSVTSFVTSGSYFYSLISDGMGNGQEAAFVSGVSAMFIEKMLSAGNRADITVRMLNNLLRNENMGSEGECSATVDLCELDLINGTASFIKSGAAPTYIARSGTVYKVYSHTMPIGILKDTDTRVSKFDTKSGDVIVMMSDGCCPDSEDCPWLVEYLCEYMSKKEIGISDQECERLKSTLLSLAVKNCPPDKPRDDISVSVIMVE